MRRYAGSTGRTAQGEWILLIIRGWKSRWWVGFSTGGCSYGVASSTKPLMLHDGSFVALYDQILTVSNPQGNNSASRKPAGPRNQPNSSSVS